MAAVATEALTAEAMITIAREHVDAFNNLDWKRMRAGLAADASYHDFGTRLEVSGPDRIIELLQGWKTAMPDLAGRVTSAVAGGDKAVLELTWTGTHTGPLETAAGTIPASGKRRETPAAIVYTFAGGKIKEGREYFDLQTFLT